MALSSLPLLPTSVIGSYAWPAWLHTALEASRRGDYGPEDMRETQDDAVDLALRDQEQAGLDIVSDGEMRRAGFFPAAFYGHLSGLRELPPSRKVGVIGHDQRESYEALEPLGAPAGLGLLAEYAYAHTRTSKPVMMPCAGPFTLAGRIKPGRVYRDRLEVAQALTPIVNRELCELAAAGARIIQIDEPSMAVRPGAAQPFIDLFDATVAGLREQGVTIGLHLCFGNFVGRPVAWRSYRPLFPEILAADADYFALEFANRELAEIELWSEFPSTKILAAGLMDVKNYHIESPQQIAGRVRAALRHVPADRLWIVPDCGLSQTARWAARAKLRSMVEGTQIVRAEVVGQI
jgi:5-methyltetrahydropteroyltriglutamate--homocysteine methyltransferase